MKSIPFNVPPFVPRSLSCLEEAARGGRISGDGPFTARCSRWLERQLCAQKVLLTTSGTHALEMAALLCGFKPGDEVILPSFTFTSTANAFVLAGARLVFVDIRPDTMNLDESLLEPAVTPRTRAVCVVHYGGVACEMEAITAFAKERGLRVVEDAAQALMAAYEGTPLGAIGDYGCLSFHETKNYSMGEGGALVLRDAADAERAEILREKGTDRSRFYRGQVDKYRWMDYGSSYLPSELNAAYLWGQLEQAEAINSHRLKLWAQYSTLLAPLARRGLLELPAVPGGCVHNGHLFYVKLKNMEERGALIEWLKGCGVLSVFHYVPLHSAPAGRKFGRFCGEDRYTTAESERLLRLPMYYALSLEEVRYVADSIWRFFGKSMG